MGIRLKKRKCRRHAIKTIIRTLEQIRDLELEYYLSIPDTHANEERNDESGHAVDSLGEIIESLRYVF